MPKQRKLVTNEQRAANVEGIFSLVAFGEAVPVPPGIQTLLVGLKLEIGLVVVGWAGERIWPFLESVAVEMGGGNVILLTNKKRKSLDERSMRYSLVLVFGAADVGLVLLHGVQLNITHSTWVALQ